MGLNSRLSLYVIGRLGRIALENEVVRALSCLVLMILMLVSGANPVISTAIPIAIYIGMQLLITTGQSKEERRSSYQGLSDRETYERCRELRQRVTELAETGWSESLAAQLARIANHLDDSLRAIAEDGAYRTSNMLCELMETTVELQERYLKLSTRGFAGGETEQRLADDLSSLEAAYRRFWDYLNRGAMAELKSLSEEIELTFGEFTATDRTEEVP